MTALVFADGRFGNVQRMQRRVFGQEYATDVASPDFRLLASAFGVRYADVDAPDALGAALEQLGEQPGPALVQVRVGEMPSPWPVIHPFVPSPVPVPPNPLGEFAGVP